MWDGMKGSANEAASGHAGERREIIKASGVACRREKQRGGGQSSVRMDFNMNSQAEPNTRDENGMKME